MDRPLVSTSIALLASLFIFQSAAAIELPPINLATACSGNCGLTTGSAAVPLSPINDSTFGYLSTFGGVLGKGSLPDVGVGKGNELSSTSPPTGSSLTSASFSAAANTQFSINFNYVSLDGSGFSDYAWARLHKVGSQDYIWLFTAMSSSQGGKNVVPGQVVDSKTFSPSAVIANFDAATFTASPTKQIAWAPLGGVNTCFDDGGSISKGCGSTGWLTSNYTFSAAGIYQLEMGVTNWGDDRFHSALAFDTQGLALQAPEPAPIVLMGAAMVLFGIKSLRRRRRRDE